MRQSALPFNISLLSPVASQLTAMRPTRVLDTYDASGVNFHEDGLFSISTFGRIASPERDLRFSYIDLKTTILHPEIFLNLKSLKSLYVAILSGKRYAKWDAKIKDFFPADEETGDTGFSFFIKYFPELVIPTTNSDIRNEKIALITKYSQVALLKNHLIMPAGLRDIQHNERGQVTEDEINDLYRRLIMTSTTISSLEEGKDSPILDTARWSLQMTAVDIYMLIKKMVSGKKGWLQGKWGARRVIHGTRNVITSMDTSVSDLDDPEALTVNDTQIGLPQALRGALPLTLHGLLAGYLGEVFGSGQSEVYVTNKKTLKKELVTLETETIDLFSTRPGLERLINRFFIAELRNKPVYVENHYLGLLYLDDHYFKIFNDIDDLPDTLDKKHVRPLTLSALLYCSTYDNFKRLVGTITRFPVTGDGSSYPTFMKVLTTTRASSRIPLDVDWNPVPENKASHFPEQTETAKWMNSAVPHTSAISGLNAD